MCRRLFVFCVGWLVGYSALAAHAKPSFSFPIPTTHTAFTLHSKTELPRLTLAYHGSLETAHQAQTVPTPPQSPMPAFDQTYLYFTIGLLAGSLVVGIGETIARQVGADPLGWQIAGVLLNGAGTVYNAVIMSQMLSQVQDPMIQALFWASLIASGIGFLVSVVQLIIQIHRHMHKPKEIPKPVALVPWGDIDERGNPRAGLALIGHF